MEHEHDFSQQFDPSLTSRVGWPVNAIEYLYALLAENWRTIQAQPGYDTRDDLPSVMPLLDAMDVLSGAMTGEELARAWEVKEALRACDLRPSRVRLGDDDFSVEFDLTDAAIQDEIADARRDSTIEDLERMCA